MRASVALDDLGSEGRGSRVETSHRNVGPSTFLYIISLFILFYFFSLVSILLSLHIHLFVRWALMLQPLGYFSQGRKSGLNDKDKRLWIKQHLHRSLVMFHVDTVYYPCLSIFKFNKVTFFRVLSYWIRSLRTRVFCLRCLETFAV